MDKKYGNKKMLDLAFDANRVCVCFILLSGTGMEALVTKALMNYFLFFPQSFFFYFLHRPTLSHSLQRSAVQGLFCSQFWCVFAHL